MLLPQPERQKLFFLHHHPSTRLFTSPAPKQISRPFPQPLQTSTHSPVPEYVSSSSMVSSIALLLLPQAGTRYGTVSGIRPDKSSRLHLPQKDRHLLPHVRFFLPLPRPESFSPLSRTWSYIWHYLFLRLRLLQRGCTRLQSQRTASLQSCCLRSYGACAASSTVALDTWNSLILPSALHCFKYSLTLSIAIICLPFRIPTFILLQCPSALQDLRPDKYPPQPL